ncbi:unnamed protein product [Rotaria sp. Silwood1]|nr:unnamed protein product [Rotaria sp. Silwood1]CAF0947147.1 unnamed protein product [Rotaria sp. Silwood1]CAF3376427.1 unnamed protein product [Rotaria sp. Silwood1]CAF3384276.1 unnamed protein product [Rotaria sp. Silwood1]CAF3399821.1 unnamed protein product [Rotaria sp. Silwood1]
MHMFPLGRVVYMPLSTSTGTTTAATTTLLGPVPTDFPSSTIPLYNTTLLSNPFNLCATTKFEHNALQQALPTLSHGYKRMRDDLHDTQQSVWPKKRSKLSPAHSSSFSANQSSTNNNNNNNNNSNNNGDGSSPSSKNALMLLHELKPSVEYKLVAQTGPSHRPIFTMAVEVNGQVFEGMAQTKKEAKQAAAEKALRSFSDLPFQLPEDVASESEATTTTATINTDNNVTNDNSSLLSENNDSSQRATQSPNVVEPREIQSGLSPLYLLNQLKRDAQFEAITDETSSLSTTINEQREFKFAVIVDGQRFIGIGRNKKIAKTRAAQLALEKLFGMCFDKEGGIPIESDTLPTDLSYSRRDLADRIASCIQEKFNQLTHNDVRLQRRKVLAGVVQTRNYDLETMEVICITTGTKCISGDRLTLNGQSLNDCHAEIIARRCLIRYCYQQLKLLIEETNHESIFEKIPDSDRFRLKSSIAFHLYISTSPCGDGRLFAPQESSSEQSSSTTVNQDPNNKQIGHSLRKSRGLLRTKIEAGEGTIPVMARTLYQSMQTWDGILGGERLLTMSCSDKLCRWNFIGLQGALLSVLIEPIYYASIIIGSLYHSEHIRRALFARIEHSVKNIPAPYGLRRPFISGVSSPEMRTTSRAPNHAFIWNCVDQKCEIVDTLNGLTTSRESSVISKAALFQQWLTLMKQIKSDTISTIYCDAKQLEVNYQTAKMEINKAFQKSGFGLWIIKPHEQDEFDLSSYDAVLLRQNTQSIPPSMD